MVSTMRYRPWVSMIPSSRQMRASGARFGERTSTGALNEYLLDPKTDPEVRGAAAKSIGELRAWDGIEACISALDDDNRAVRQAAIMSVEQSIGLHFPYYKVDDTKANRQIAMEKIREVLPGGKRVYERYWEEKEKPKQKK